MQYATRRGLKDTQSCVRLVLCVTGRGLKDTQSCVRFVLCVTGRSLKDTHSCVILVKCVTGRGFKCAERINTTVLPCTVCYRKSLKASRVGL